VSVIAGRWARGEAFPLSSPGQEQHVNEAHDRDEDAVGEPLRSASSKASRESLDDACLDERLFQTTKQVAAKRRSTSIGRE
jgi:hypothetical protein